ncbi:MAG: pilus assembly protein N-terminal domain-containing protein [Planctomycetota bacterium]
MYARHAYPHAAAGRLSALISAVCLTACLLPQASLAQTPPSVIRNITQANERVELTVNTSKLLTLEKRIPKMVVNNPELVTVTALSANQIMLAATKPGVTQVNLWDEEGNVFAVDVVIYGDVQELTMALKRLFPESSVKVMRLSNSLVLEGFVERPEAVSPIIRLAEDYAPKVVNNIVVGGVQQVMLKVKVMEVSRTKLRRLGFDFAQFSSGGGFVASSISGLISSFDSASQAVTTSGETVAFGVVDGGDSFFGFLDALQRNNVAKILADPTITAVSGRPANFNVGGELPIIIPSGIGQTTIEYKPFGTQVDFVPIVLGNGKVRLEVRPRISSIDDTLSVNIDEFSVPALTVRQVDTAVELRCGQTLALAGLVQTRVDAEERGIPFLADLPLVGAAFRSVEEEVNEIELLILVTPEFADGLEPHEVPPCGPGMESISPSNCDLYVGGHLEVPAPGPCGPGCAPGCYGKPYQQPPLNESAMGMGPQGGAAGPVMVTDGYATPMELPPQPSAGSGQPAMNQPQLSPSQGARPTIIEQEQLLPSGPSIPDTVPSADPAASGPSPLTVPVVARAPQAGGASWKPHVGAVPTAPARRTTSTPGLIGPIGYDVEK